MQSTNSRLYHVPFGDAILAGVISGTLPDFSVAKEWVEHIDRMDPIAGSHERYMLIERFH